MATNINQGWAHLRTMKIMHIIVGLGVGGAESALKRLVESHQSDSRYRHAVVSLTTVGQGGAQLQDMGVEVRALGMRGVLDVPITLWRLVRLMQSQRPDIVQTWMYHADLMGGLAARLAGCRNIIWGIRATEVAAGSSRATAWVRWLCARWSAWIPHTIVCVAKTSRSVHEALGYSAARMVVVPNGFDLKHLQVTPGHAHALRLECGFAVGDLVVGTLGRFNAAKDQHNFVRAAALLGQQFPAIKFLMVGRGCDAANAELTGWIAAAGLTRRFVLLGERCDAPVCLAAMDVFCLSSRTEAFPNVVGEAMAMRKACVVTDVGDAAYLLGSCGVVVPKEDAQALADGLTQVLNLSTAERAALGQRAHARIAAEFTMDRTRQCFEAVYARVLA